MQHIPLPLQFPPHSHECRLQQDTPLLQREPFPDDEVDLPGLVLEGHEHDTAGAPGALPRDDQARRMDQAAMLQAPEISGTRHGPAGQAGAQQRQRVAPQRQAGAGVVGDDVLALRGPAQQGNAFADLRPRPQG